MDNITFEQLPQAVSMLIEKVGQLADKVEKVLGNTGQKQERRLLTLDDVATLLDKSSSTILRHDIRQAHSLPQERQQTLFLRE